MNIVLPFRVPEYSHRQHMWIEVLKLLRWHGHVRLLMSSKVLERKMSNSSYMRRAARVKRLGARIVFLCEDWLSLSHSFLLPLSLFLLLFFSFFISVSFFHFFISFSLLFFSFFFSPSFFFSSKPELTPSSNKETPRNS